VALAPLHPLFGDPSKVSTPIFPSVGGASDQGGLFAGFTPAIDAQTENRRGLI
jgi:hypothetical protein